MQDSQDPNTPVQNAANDPTQMGGGLSQPPQPQLQVAHSQDFQSQQTPPVNVFDQSQNPADQPMAGMNAVISQAAAVDPLNPAYPTASTVKERAPLTVEMSGEMPSGMQSVEQLRTPEISPEVEKYIEEVKEEPSQFPHEVVLADQKLVQPAGGFMAQPVIVLPMTQEEFKEAKKAPPDTARRWLAEFTDKVKKMFAGAVIFREEKAA